MSESSDFIKGAEYVNSFKIKDLLERMIETFVDSHDGNIPEDIGSVEDEGDFMDGMYEELSNMLLNREVIKSIERS